MAEGPALAWRSLSRRGPGGRPRPTPQPEDRGFYLELPPEEIWGESLRVPGAAGSAARHDHPGRGRMRLSAYGFALKCELLPNADSAKLRQM